MGQEMKEWAQTVVEELVVAQSRLQLSNSTSIMKLPTASGTRRLWCLVGIAGGPFCQIGFRFIFALASQADL
jgi:hypothetical protein